MFCRNCGKEVSDTVKFCSGCGTPIPSDAGDLNTANVPSQEEESVLESVEVSDTEPVETVQENSTVTVDEEVNKTENDIKPKKKSKKKIGIIAATLGVIVAAGAIAAAASPAVRNMLARTFMSPKAYFQYIVEKNAKESAKDVSKALTVYKDSYNGNFSVNGDVTVKLGDGMNDLMQSLGAPSDFIQGLDWLKSLKMTVDSDLTNQAMETKVGYNLNGTDIATIDAVFDMAGENFYMGVPEINAAYMRVPMDEMGMMQDVLRICENVMKSCPSEEVVTDISCRYVKCVASGIEEVEKSSETVEADGVSQKLTVLTATVGDKELENITKAVLTEFKNDKEIEKIIEDVSSADPSLNGLKEGYDELIDDIDDVIDEVEFDFDEEFKIDFYVDDSGTLQGFGFDEQGVEVLLVNTQNGKEFGMCLEVNAGGSFKIEGNGTKSGDKASGMFEVKAMGMSIVEIEFSDVDTKKLEEQTVFDGKFTIQIPKQAAQMLGEMNDDIGNVIEDLKLVVTAKSESLFKGSAEFVLLKGNAPCITVTTNAQGEKGGAEINIPTSSVDANDYDASQNWVSSANLDTIISRLKAAGLPSYIVDEMQESVEPTQEDDIYEDYYGYEDYEDYYEEF